MRGRMREHGAPAVDVPSGKQVRLDLQKGEPSFARSTWMYGKKQKHQFPSSKKKNHICSNIFTITQDDNFGTVHHGFFHQNWGYFIVNLFHEGWARRMLHWQFCGRRVAGRCALNSEDKK